ncbi:MAG: peptide ABC transporter substrate-binding protein [Anaerolineae bacterium]|nr:peptide ABC transporter substrate-binding protein [Anaerolineae bacterium]
MLRRYGVPLAALLISITLLLAVGWLRGTDTTSATSTPNAEATTTFMAFINRAPTQPPASLTPAPTIPFQQIDTSTLNEALVGNSCVTKLNPLLAGYNHADRDIVSLIFDGLMTTDQRGAIVPDLAAAQPTVSEDGLIYVITLRTDVKWQDGVQFTSDDVIFTIRTIQSADFPGPTDLRDFWRTVDVDAIDAQTVRFTLAQPLATFTDYLRIGMVPEHVLRGTTGATLSTHPFNLSPIGTGAYQFAGLIGTSSQRTGVRLRFAPTFAERPEGQSGYAIKQIIFHCVPTFDEAIAAFQRGEVNTINLIAPEALGQVAALSINPLPAYRPSLGAVIYNWQKDTTVFFRDLRLRQALAYSVDRTALVTKHLADRAIVADSPILPSSWAYASGVRCPTYDLERAKNDLSLVQLIPTAVPTTAPDATAEVSAAPAMANEGEGSGKIRFQILSSNDPSMAAMANDIVASWKELGVDVSLIVVDRSTFRDRLATGNFDAALVELNLEPFADPDPYSLWRQSPAEGGLNFGGLNERRLSEIMEAARREPNGITRASLYQQFQQLFCDRAAAIPLFYPAYFYGVDRRLTGVQIGFMSDPSDRFRTLRDWRYVEQ